MWVLLDVYSDVEAEMANQANSYRIDYAKQAMTSLVRAYMEEVKWFHKQNIPTVDEFTEVALVTSAYPRLATTSFAGMGYRVTKNSFHWLFSNPKMFVQKRGHVASAVECYMKQWGATEGEAVNEFGKGVSNAWNLEGRKRRVSYPTTVPMPLLVRVGTSRLVVLKSLSD